MKQENNFTTAIDNLDTYTPDPFGLKDKQEVKYQYKKGYTNDGSRYPYSEATDDANELMTLRRKDVVDGTDVAERRLSETLNRKTDENDDAENIYRDKLFNKLENDNPYLLRAAEARAEREKAAEPKVEPTTTKEEPKVVVEKEQATSNSASQQKAIDTAIEKEQVVPTTQVNKTYNNKLSTEDVRVIERINNGAASDADIERGYQIQKDGLHTFGPSANKAFEPYKRKDELNLVLNGDYKLYSNSNITAKDVIDNLDETAARKWITGFTGDRTRLINEYKNKFGKDFVEYGNENVPNETKPVNQPVSSETVNQPVSSETAETDKSEYPEVNAWRKAKSEYHDIDTAYKNYNKAKEVNSNEGYEGLVEWYNSLTKEEQEDYNKYVKAANNNEINPKELAKGELIDTYGYDVYNLYVKNGTWNPYSDDEYNAAMVIFDNIDKFFSNEKDKQNFIDQINYANELRAERSKPASEATSEAVLSEAASETVPSETVPSETNNYSDEELNDVARQVREGYEDELSEHNKLIEKEYVKFDDHIQNIENRIFALQTQKASLKGERAKNPSAKNYQLEMSKIDTEIAALEAEKEKVLADKEEFRQSVNLAQTVQDVSKLGINANENFNKQEVKTIIQHFQDGDYGRVLSKSEKDKLKYALEKGFIGQKAYDEALTEDRNAKKMLFSLIADEVGTSLMNIAALYKGGTVNATSLYDRIEQAYMNSKLEAQGAAQKDYSKEITKNYIDITRNLGKNIAAGWEQFWKGLNDGYKLSLTTAQAEVQQENLRIVSKMFGRMSNDEQADFLAWSINMGRLGPGQALVSLGADVILGMMRNFNGWVNKNGQGQLPVETKQVEYETSDGESKFLDMGVIPSEDDLKNHNSTLKQWREGTLDTRKDTMQLLRENGIDEKYLNETFIVGGGSIKDLYVLNAFNTPKRFDEIVPIYKTWQQIRDAGLEHNVEILEKEAEKVWKGLKNTEDLPKIKEYFYDENGNVKPEFKTTKSFIENKVKELEELKAKEDEKAAAAAAKEAKKAAEAKAKEDKKAVETIMKNSKKIESGKAVSFYNNAIASGLLDGTNKQTVFNDATAAFVKDLLSDKQCWITKDKAGSWHFKNKSTSSFSRDTNLYKELYSRIQNYKPKDETEKAFIEDVLKTLPTPLGKSVSSVLGDMLYNKSMPDDVYRLLNSKQSIANNNLANTTGEQV